MHQASAISTVTAGPVRQGERITILDSLRGFAILGILLMNIPFFAFPVKAAYDPSVYNEAGTINFSFWYYVEWIFAGTQRALFSMLFGAGILLFIGRKESHQTGMRPADYFFRRQLWLILFSVFDVFILLWYGDILFDYAVLGMAMFAFRNLPPKKLLIGAVVCLAFMMLRDNYNLYQKKATIHRGEIAARIDTTKTKLNFEQQQSIEAMNTLKEESTNAYKLKDAEKEAKIVSGAYHQVYKSRTQLYIEGMIEYLYLGFWDVLIFMFIGMAFFKMGILTGEAPTKLYAWICIVGLGAGLFFSYLLLDGYIKYGFNTYDYSKHVSFSVHQFQRVLRSLGLFGLIMLLYKSGVFKWLFALLRPVGQMAFTNYLLQSFLCGLLFYGIGLGYFNQFERYQIYYALAAVWLFEILLSHIWLRFFYYGPFEWAWRSLTYWKRQPFRKISS